jgi:hypothetical protein
LLRKQDAQLRPPVSAGRRLISSVLAANSIRIENSANRVKSAVPQVVHPEQRIHSLTFCPICATHAAQTASRSV